MNDAMTHDDRGDGAPPDALGPLADRWAIPLVLELSQGVRRFSELERVLEGVSSRMLARTLQRLEGHGVVDRTVHPGVPAAVEYSLTAAGAQAAVWLEGLCSWSRSRSGEGRAVAC